MFTKRRLIILACLVLAVVAGFFVYKRVTATECTPMSGTNQAVDAQLVAGNTKFAFELYHVLAKDKSSNFIYSPYSISQLLAMLDMGADGQTKAQITQVLNFTLPEPQLHAGFQALNNNLINNAQNPEGMWCNANALWVEKNFALDATYLAQVKNFYGSDVQFADFKSNAKGATGTINRWVQNQTKDRIKELFSPLDSDTRLVLANAVYFKNNWETAFPKSATRDDKFTLLDRQPVTVPMMKMEDSQSFNYFQGKNFQMIELLYKGKYVSMVILMPDEGQFNAVETMLDADQFQTAVQSLAPRQVKLSMPRFKIEYELPMKSALQEMGVTDAFDPNLANLARLKSSAAEPLYVHQALHKAYVNIDEQGTEAAAASGLVARPISVVGGGNYEVKIDHPFLFAICDRETGAILFIGRVLNPKL